MFYDLATGNQRNARNLRQESTNNEASIAPPRGTYDAGFATNDGGFILVDSRRHVSPTRGERHANAMTLKFDFQVSTNALISSNNSLTIPALIFESRGAWWDPTWQRSLQPHIWSAIELEDGRGYLFVDKQGWAWVYDTANRQWRTVRRLGEGTWDSVKKLNSGKFALTNSDENIIAIIEEDLGRLTSGGTSNYVSRNKSNDIQLGSGNWVAISETNNNDLCAVDLETGKASFYNTTTRQTLKQITGKREIMQEDISAWDINSSYDPEDIVAWPIEENGKHGIRTKVYQTSQNISANPMNQEPGTEGNTDWVEISGNLFDHLQKEVNTICTLWEIEREDGQHFYFTDHDEDITYLDGNMYRSDSGYNRTNIESQDGLNVNNLDVTGFFLERGRADEGATADAVRAGLFDYAKLTIRLINWCDHSDGHVVFQRGRFGEIIYNESNGTFTTSVRGLVQLYQQQGVELVQPTCQADFCDKRCKLDVKRFTLENVQVTRVDPEKPRSVFYTGRLTYVNRGKTSTMDTPEDRRNEVHRDEPSYERQPTDTRITDTGTFDPSVSSIGSGSPVAGGFQEGTEYGPYQYGRAMFADTTDNIGLNVEIKKHSLVGNEERFELFIDAGCDIQVGDIITLVEGCDKKYSTCIQRYKNIFNFRGFPDLPGADRVGISKARRSDFRRTD